MSTSKTMYIVRLWIMTVIPLLVASVMATIWYLIFWKGKIHFSKEDGEALTDCNLFFITAYAILAAITAEGAVKEFKNLRQAMILDNEELFKTNIAKEVPTALHFFLGCMAFLMMICFCVREYHSVQSGLFIIWITSFGLALYWKIVSELDNPSGPFYQHSDSKWKKLADEYSKKR